MKKLGTMGSLSPFIPTGGGSAGLVEKRLGTFSALALTDAADFLGDFNHYLSSLLELDYDVDGHLNHGQDPAASILSLSTEVSRVMIWARALESIMSITDYVHVTLDGLPKPNGIPMTANETVVVGQPVYVSGDATVNLADASDPSTARAIGLAATAAASNESVMVLAEGQLEQSDWTSIIGTALLTPGTNYFLSLTTGQMTATAPDNTGEVIVFLGTAITTTKFDIEVNEIAIL
jgi:hypothetical protein